MEKIIIFDSGNPDIINNKLFDRAYVYPISHTFLPICHLYEKIQQLKLTQTNNDQEGSMSTITLITPDIFLNDPKKFENKKVFLISQLTNPNTEKLISHGVTPLLLLCQESPFIATRFFLNLNKISSLFKYSSVFSGMKKKLNNKTQYLQMFFPQTDAEIIKDRPNFAAKKFLTMISSSKSVGNWKKDLLLKLTYGIGVKEIYAERTEAIKFFAQNNNFDLFGRSWDSIIAEKTVKIAVKKAYRGTVEDKLETLKNYKFALCFENSIFEGYVTEKIFDAFFAGVIPIYYGAPDIEKYVPENTFIDFRKFNNYEDLNTFLINMGEQEYISYIRNIEIFLQSEQFYLFSQENFANSIIDLINKE